MSGVGGLANSELNELKEMLKQQQIQINQLTRSIAAVQEPPRRNRPPHDGPVICRRCQRPGHYARECDGERVVGSSRASSGVIPSSSDRGPSQAVQPQGN